MFDIKQYNCNAANSMLLFLASLNNCCVKDEQQMSRPFSNGLCKGLFLCAHHGFLWSFICVYAVLCFTYPCGYCEAASYESPCFEENISMNKNIDSKPLWNS